MANIMRNENAVWEAETYDIFQVEIELDGVKKTIKPWAGKWNRYIDYTGDSIETRRENAAVRNALAAEIEKRKNTGQKPDYSDQEA